MASILHHPIKSTASAQISTARDRYWARVAEDLRQIESIAVSSAVSSAVNADARRSA